MKQRVFALCLFLLGGALPAAALAAGSSVAVPEAPIVRSDYASLQRGAAAFINYCSGCHSAQYVRYGRLSEDLGITDDMVQQHLIWTDAGLGDGILTAMRADDAKAWFSDAAPPDLSLSARLRGADWLYAYLRGFYRDDTRAIGWNNTIFANASMPHVLASLQGEQRLADDGTLTLARAGRMSPAEYDTFVLDLVNFMDYMADPSQPARHRTGYIILAVLLALLIFTYFLYQEYWRDIK